MRYYHDLTTYHTKRDLNGMTIIAGWVKDNEENAWKRTLYLMPEGYYGKGTEHIYFIIENFETHAIALDAGPDIGRKDFAYTQARAALHKMGLTDSLTNQHLVISIINDHLDDLTLMPPRPAPEKVIEADLIIKNALTGQTHETHVMGEA